MFNHFSAGIRKVFDFNIFHKIYFCRSSIFNLLKTAVWGFFFSPVKYAKKALSELMLINGCDFLIFGYARVSTNSQARDGNSLEAQIKLLKDA